MIKLIIADSNKNYMKALSNYLQGEYGHLFDITCFSSEQGLQQHLRQEEPVDMLLIDNRFCETGNGFEKAKVTMMLTENAHESDAAVIYKYQNAENIAKHIFRVYDNASIGIIYSHQKNLSCKLVCVYSSSGGAGKTTVAYNLAVQFAMQKKKVLFLSLETYCSLSQLNNTDGSMGLIYLLYLVKNKLNNLQLKLDNLKKVDIAAGVHYIPRESNVLEYKDISIEDVSLLADFLRKQSGYDVVIFDLDSTLNETVLGSAKCCDVIINVVCCETGLDKQQEFLGQIPQINDLLEQDLSKKVLHIINKHNVVRDSDGLDYDNWKACLKVPYLNGYYTLKQVYYPEMTCFKELYDILESFYIERGLEC